MIPSALFLWSAVAGATPLPMDHTTPVDLLRGAANVYTVDVSEAGFLSVVLRGEAHRDLVFDVLDEDGQLLLDGHVDGDQGGDVAAEQGVVVLPWSGHYQVRVREINARAVAFVLGGTFLPAPVVAWEPPLHGRPSHALVVRAGDGATSWVDATIGPPWTWLRVDGDPTAALTVSVTSEDGDLVLERFVAGGFFEPLEVSDQDLDGQLSHERLTLSAEASAFYRVRDRDKEGRVTFDVQTSAVTTPPR